MAGLVQLGAQLHPRPPPGLASASPPPQPQSELSGRPPASHGPPPTAHCGHRITDTGRSQGLRHTPQSPERPTALPKQCGRLPGAARKLKTRADSGPGGAPALARDPASAAGTAGPSPLPVRRRPPPRARALGSRQGAAGPTATPQPRPRAGSARAQRTTSPRRRAQEQKESGRRPGDAGAQTSRTPAGRPRAPSAALGGAGGRAAEGASARPEKKETEAGRPCARPATYRPLAPPAAIRSARARNAQVPSRTRVRSHLRGPPTSGPLPTPPALGPLPSPNPKSPPPQLGSPTDAPRTRVFSRLPGPGFPPARVPSCAPAPAAPPVSPTEIPLQPWSHRR
ncbi:basic proline-rich protein-like [Eumetopias jubatus]|uniref:basic proline-rich protein-like n=1 Tax=Eumetopias jubatus TaxID=34886 RepID=UPI001016EB65|nr:basic proline-rich protein-like [Eumetopias jubatus]